MNSSNSIAMAKSDEKWLVKQQEVLNYYKKFKSVKVSVL